MGYDEYIGTGNGNSATSPLELESSEATMLILVLE